MVKTRSARKRCCDDDTSPEKRRHTSEPRFAVDQYGVLYHPVEDSVSSTVQINGQAYKKLEGCEDGRKAELLFYTALANKAMGDRPTAIANLDRALQYRNRTHIRFLKLQLFSEENQHEKMLECCEELMKPNPHLYIYKISALTNLGRLEETKAVIDEAIQLFKPHSFWWFEHGQICILLKQFSESLESFDKALALDPTDKLKKNIHKFRGTALSMMGRYEEAIESFDKGLVLDTTDINLYYNKAKTMLMMKADARATLELTERVCNMDKTDADAWWLHAKVLRQLDRNEEALHSINTAIDVSSDGGKIGMWRDKGCILSSLQKYELACKSLDHALNMAREHKK